MPCSTVLLVGVNPPVHALCEEVIGTISDLRCAVIACPLVAQALPLSANIHLALINLAAGMAVEPIVAWLRRMTSVRRPIPTLVLAERYEEEERLRLLRLGAADYLGPPLDRRRLTYLITTLIAQARHRCRAESAPDLAPGPEPSDTAWESPLGTMGALLEQVRTVAPQRTTVLLTGETGTGKTRLARMLHDLSPRRAAPFRVVNCGALAGDLIESEMFGHVKGAFTGADRDRPGKFAEAGEGTLLLDEVDALPLSLQAKLLHAVEERVFEPVGSNRSHPMLARLVAASSRALAHEVEASRFRADLYFRLNVVAFDLPPLRERRDEIATLTTHFLHDFADRNSRPARALADEALTALQDYHWPGNIRELRNVIERAVALSPGEVIQLADLPEAVRGGGASGFSAPSPRAPASSPSPYSQLATACDQGERDLIVDALRKTGNNRLRAAAALGISRRTLYKKLHRYGLVGNKAC
jgi:DNA-binding NtrC family response regulator